MHLGPGDRPILEALCNNNNNNPAIVCATDKIHMILERTEYKLYGDILFIMVAENINKILTDGKKGSA